MSKRNPELLIGDMLESIINIESYTENMSYDEFIGDRKTRDAVIRNIEIIGEAASRLPAEFCARNSEIDWRAIKGSRNRIVHEYFGVDLSII